MASNNLDYEVLPATPASWPELLSKTVDDLSKIVRTEIAVLERTLQRVVESQTDRVSRPGESHPQALAEPYMNVSAHTAPIIQPSA